MAGHGWRRGAYTQAAVNRHREYGTPQYRHARAEAKKVVAAGYGYCWRCRGWIPPESRWHLGHDDWDREVIRGPEHARCNLAAASRKGRQIAAARRQFWAL